MFSYNGRIGRGANSGSLIDQRSGIDPEIPQDQIPTPRELTGMLRFSANDLEEIYDVIITDANIRAVVRCDFEEQMESNLMVKAAYLWSIALNEGIAIDNYDDFGKARTQWHHTEAVLKCEEIVEQFEPLIRTMLE
jgi:hypothetical protein